MSQYQQAEYQDPYSGGAGGEGPGGLPPKTSGLAIGALICSLIFCCPVTTLLGILLGLIAVITIGRDPMKKGKGLAVIAIVLGIVFTILQAWGGTQAYMYFYRPIIDGPNDALTAGFNGNHQGMLDAMHTPSTSPTTAEAQEFVDELRDRYGALISVHLNEQAANQQGPQPGQPEAVFPYVYTFENATLDGEAMMVFADQTTGDFVMKPRWFTIEDPDRGDLTFPPDADTTAPPAGNGATNGEGEGEGADTTDDADAGGGEAAETEGDGG